jgi:selenocysteine lyase/cysteine desulfurase
MSQIYFNTAATGIVDKSLIEKTNQLYFNMTNEPATFAENWSTTAVPEIKELIAQCFGAKNEEVALVPNFSFGVNVLLNALPENSNVLCYKKDYPSLLDPLDYKNFNIFQFDDKDGFEIYLETIERHIKKHYIDFLLISHVQWRTGFKINLKQLSALCKKNNVKLIVDATQSAGAIDINFDDSDTDAILFSCYKWLNAGFGTGVMLMKADFLEEFPPKISGMHSYQYIDGKPVLIPSMKFYEPGHLNLYGFSILKEVLEGRPKTAIQDIELKNRELTEYFIKNFKSEKVKIIGKPQHQHRSSIVYLNGDEEFQKFLVENGVSCSFREGHTRLSFHTVTGNNLEELDKVLDLIGSY